MYARKIIGIRELQTGTGTEEEVEEEEIGIGEFEVHPPVRMISAG